MGEPTLKNYRRYFDFPVWPVESEAELADYADWLVNLVGHEGHTDPHVELKVDLSGRDREPPIPIEEFRERFDEFPFDKIVNTSLEVRDLDNSLILEYEMSTSIFGDPTAIVTINGTDKERVNRIKTKVREEGEARLNAREERLAVAKAKAAADAEFKRQEAALGIGDVAGQIFRAESQREEERSRRFKTRQTSPAPKEPQQEARSMSDRVIPTLSRKSLLALVNVLSGFTLAEIDNFFVGNGLNSVNQDYEPREWAAMSGQRRNKAASYLSAIDMADEVQRVRLLRVFDDVLQALPEAAEATELGRLLERDGVRRDSGNIALEHLRLPDRPQGRLQAALPDYSKITDTEVLREHAERMQHASLKADAPDAILAARELLESVCKLICEDYDVEIPKSPNAGELYKLAAKPLGLDAQDIPGEDDATKASRKVLSGLVRVADGLGDLRTRVGRGHGRTKSSSARQRHAELATGAAGTLAVFLLDTWQDRKVKGAAPKP